MTKAAISTLGRVERVDLGKRGKLMARYDHLANSVAIMYGERLVGEIDEDGANLPTVIGIDGARRIENSDATLGSETAAGAYLRLEALRELDEDACRDNSPRKRL